MRINGNRQRTRLQADPKYRISLWMSGERETRSGYAGPPSYRAPICIRVRTLIVAGRRLLAATAVTRIHANRDAQDRRLVSPWSSSRRCRTRTLRHWGGNEAAGRRFYRSGRGWKPYWISDSRSEHVADAQGFHRRKEMQSIRSYSLSR